MKVLMDRCAGKRLADWLGGQGHDVLEARTLGPDPGDRDLLEMAAKQERVLI
jgi:predicted nuclease of predicted toxin-antitoxin system